MRGKPRNLENLYSELCQKIESQGYEVDHCSIRNSYYINDYDSITIFDPNEKAVRDDIFYFYGIRHPSILGRERMLEVGRLWVENEARKARPDVRWVLEVYGRSNLQRMESLAENLAKEYQRKMIHVRLDLAQEELAYELFNDDFPPLFG